MRNIILLSIINTMLFSAVSFAQTSWYVSSERGSDKNDGTVDTPFKTIMRAVENVKAGDTILLETGVYREQVIFNENPQETKSAVITLKPVSGNRPVIKGSDIVRKWKRYNDSIWVRKHWEHNSQQVFVDGTVLKQIGFSSDAYPSTARDGNWMIRKIGNGVNDMFMNTFFYDREKQKLYICLKPDEDPNKKLIEASVRKHIVDASNSSYINIEGITFRHSNTSAFKQGGAALEMGSFCTVENCDIQWCDFAGISPGHNSTGTKIINCIINNNGDSGVSASRSFKFLIKDCIVNDNNYRLFNQDWHAGGLKIVTHSYGTIENCEVGNNLGVGIWFDWNHENAGESVVRNCRVYNNARMGGIMVEASERVSLIDNTLYGNDQFGIHYVVSSYGKIIGNTIAGHRGFIALDVSGPRKHQEFPLRDNVIKNNTIINSECTFDIHIIRPDGKYVLNNVCDYNLYVRKGGPKLRYNEGGKNDWKDILVTEDIEKWRETTGYDKHSIVIEPDNFEFNTIQTK